MNRYIKQSLVCYVLQVYKPLMKNIKLSLSVLFLVFNAQAELRSAGAVTTELKGTRFTVSVKSGFHLNEKAPNALTLDETTFKPTRLASQAAEFSNLPKAWSKGRASLYVCDDAITFCEMHYVDLKGGISTQEKKESKTKGQMNKHGFIEDDLNHAIALAKKERRLLLVDFSARWCPGCVRFESETFNTKEFKQLTQDYIKVKIDVDRFENVVLSEKFKIAAIPTLLVMDSEQKEVNRLIDYQPSSVLNRFFSAIKMDPSPIQQLLDHATPQDSQFALRLGKRLVDAGRYTESIKYLSQVKPNPVELAYAKVEAAASEYKLNKEYKNQYIKTLKDAIENEPTSSRAIVWRTSLIGLLEDKAEIKKIMQEGIDFSDALLADAQKLKSATESDLVGEFTNYESLLVAVNRADLIETADVDPVLIKQAWGKAADIGKSLKISPTQSGPALRYLIILNQAELFEDANQWALKILKSDPNNADVQRRRLKALLGLKRYSEAVVVGEKSLKNSYDRNEIWVAESLAKAYLATKKTQQAKSLVDKYLNRSEIEWSNLKASRKNLEDLKVQISKEL